MKHSKKISIKTDPVDSTIIRSAFLFFACIFLLISMVTFSATTQSSQAKQIKKTKFKTPKSKKQDSSPHSKVTLLSKKQSNLLLIETSQEVTADIYSIEEDISTTTENTDEVSGTVEPVNDTLETEIASAEESSDKPVAKYISVAEEFLETQPNTSLIAAEDPIQIIQEPMKEWDTSVDLTNIYGSDAYVPRFISLAGPKVCSHNNGSTEKDQWLIRHQETDGHWDTGQHEGAGTHEIDCAATAAALLSLQSQGYTTQYGKYKNNVKSGLEWLASQQKPDGSWDKNNYVNAICTMCLAEATGMSYRGLLLKEKTELAVNFLLKQQNSSGLFDYSGPSKIDNMTVTGWCLFALKSAQLANIKELEIKEVFLKCNEFLNTIEGTNDNTIKSKGLAWYLPGVRGTGNPGGACQATAMVIRQYSGWNRSEPWLVAAATGQSINLPKDMQSLDIYRLYFTNFALFQNGGQAWKDWYSHVLNIVKEAQHTEGDLKGSWDNNGSSTDVGGRVLNTALINISFEIHGGYGRSSRSVVK